MTLEDPYPDPSELEDDGMASGERWEPGFGPIPDDAVEADEDDPDVQETPVVEDDPE